MPLILQLETATPTCSVALSESGNTIAVKEITEPNAHGTQLTLFIQDVVAAAGRQLSDIEAVAVSKGPGSYTGLRIGVSVAKGLCFSLGVPLIGVDTLKSMANGLRKEAPAHALLCPMIDARRMEVYTAVYDAGLNVLQPVGALIVEAGSFSGFADRQLIFFGDGAAKCREKLTGENTAFIENFHNSASSISSLAFEKFRAGAFEDLAYFEPYYLKEFLFKTKT
jgi:tRNA threonylcarbamoyladenosine biosynthesis protein TsaB